VRSILNKNGGQLATAGAVSYQFSRKGTIVYNAEDIDTDALFEAALEAGAEDVDIDNDIVEVITEPADFGDVLESLQAAGFSEETAEVSMIPETTVTLDNEKTNKVLQLIEKLEDCDDVQSVASNLDVPDDFEMTD
jgi:YebC/PmpR family DNA-binding regulatory protein